MTQFKLSPSTLKLMVECQRCFWLDKHKVWFRPDKNRPFPGITHAMDRILKNHFDKFRDKGEMPPELCENQTCQGIKLFEDKELLETWRKSTSYGLKWEREDGNILGGGIDNMMIKDGKLIILDYKTSGVSENEEKVHYSQNQLDTYTLVLQKNGHETEDYAFLLFYSPKNVTTTGEVIFDTELIKVLVIPENAENLFNEAIKLLNGECPKETCNWCVGAKNAKRQ